jgi:hypothetical protein
MSMNLLDDRTISIYNQLILNLKIDTAITIFLVVILWIVILDVIRIAFFTNARSLKVS